MFAGLTRPTDRFMSDDGLLLVSGHICLGIPLEKDDGSERAVALRRRRFGEPEGAAQVRGHVPQP
jgi:hypothetical protein